MRSFAALGAFALALAAFPHGAYANGRFPEAQRLLEHPSDPNRLFLTGTWGLLMSENRGADWYYVCESAFALAYLAGDPELEVFPDGTLVGGIYQSLNRSTNCGCAWTPTLDGPDTQGVLDQTQDRDGKLVALVEDSTTLPKRLYLYESSDRGATWQKLPDLPADLPTGYTVDVAPSDPERLYVTACSAATGATAVLLVSENRGQTWDAREITDTSSSIQPFIAAVSSTDPDTLYVRTNHWDDSEAYPAQDSLLLSEDAGKTWREILHHEAKLFGFALSPDGSTVLAGYGDPIEAGRFTNPDDFGIYKASTTDFAFEKIHAGAISCLRWTPTGVYACLANVPDAPSPDLALGFAHDADFTLATANPLTPLLDTKEVKGPLACTGAICAETWSDGLQGNVSVCQALGAPCDGDFSSNAVSCPMGPGGTGGMGGEGGEPGTGGGAGTTGGTGNGASANGGAATGGSANGGAPGGATAGGASATGGNGPAGNGSGAGASDDSENDDSGCGCRSAGTESSRASALAALALAAFALRVRSRRARKSR